MRRFRAVLFRITLEVFLLIRHPALIPVICKLSGMQLTPKEVKQISDVVIRRNNCNLLVFGVGNDSIFWHRINRNGKTLFIEDHPGWMQKITSKYPELNVIPFTYATKLAHWRSDLASPEHLADNLPEAVRGGDWDVILVDAPAGYKPHLPGRVQSIYIATTVAKAEADIFVHDVHREVEQTACDHFFKSSDLVAQIGKLRHYHRSRHSQ